jgi:hypothetical protein
VNIIYGVQLLNSRSTNLVARLYYEIRMTKSRGEEAVDYYSHNIEFAIQLGLQVEMI